MLRREFLQQSLSALAIGVLPSSNAGEKLAAAARAQVGVTKTYDPHYSRIGYPNGDVTRTTGVCADVVVRAGRDGLGLDLQRLVHEDMTREFAAYPRVGAVAARCQHRPSPRAEPGNLFPAGEVRAVACTRGCGREQFSRQAAARGRANVAAGRAAAAHRDGDGRWVALHPRSTQLGQWRGGVGAGDVRASPRGGALSVAGVSH